MNAPLHHALKDHLDGLWRHCRALTRSDVDAEELLQETLLRALHRPPSLDRPIGPWLKRVARNLATDRHREHARFRPIGEVDPPAPETIDRVGLDDRARGVAADLVVRLDVTQLAVLVLREALDLSAEETGGALGLSPGNVRVMAHRLRKTLQGPPPLDPADRAQAVQDFLAWAVEERVYDVATLVRLVRRDGGRGGTVLDTAEGRRVWAWLIDSAAQAVAVGANRVTAHRLWIHAYALESEDRWAEARAAYLDALAQARRDDNGPLRCHTAVRVLVMHLYAHDLDGFRQSLASLQPDLEAPVTHDVVPRALQGNLLLRSGHMRASGDVFRDLMGHASGRDRAALAHNVALADVLDGRLDSARAHAEAALAQHRADGDRDREGRTLNALGMVCQNAGEFDEAESWFNEADEALNAASSRAVPSVYTNLGLLAQERGDARLARTWFERARRLADDLGSTRSATIALVNLAVLDHATDDPAGCAARLAPLATRLSDTGQDHLRAFVLAHLGAARAASGQPEGGLLAEAREVFVRLDAGPMLLVTDALDAVAEVWRVRASDPDADPREAAAATLRRLGDREAELRFAAVRIALSLLRRALTAPRPDPGDGGRTGA